MTGGVRIPQHFGGQCIRGPWRAGTLPRCPRIVYHPINFLSSNTTTMYAAEGCIQPLGVLRSGIQATPKVDVCLAKLFTHSPRRLDYLNFPSLCVLLTSSLSV